MGVQAPYGLDGTPVGCRQTLWLMAAALLAAAGCLRVGRFPSPNAPGEAKRNASWWHMMSFPCASPATKTFEPQPRPGQDRTPPTFTREFIKANLSRPIHGPRWRVPIGQARETASWLAHRVFTALPDPPSCFPAQRYRRHAESRHDSQPRRPSVSCLRLPRSLYQVRTVLHMCHRDALCTYLRAPRPAEGPPPRRHTSTRRPRTPEHGRP